MSRAFAASIGQRFTIPWRYFVAIGTKSPASAWAQQGQLLQPSVRVHFFFALGCFFGTGLATASRASRSAFNRSRF